ncbi:unnamed protein product [Plutella xylostella]|uniref:(diamondback moth) hypothetical protein n=1 Tax=Plutella xylostella TaxID=51655 RepID=A0A8S4G0J9_PLUXY|nr:unnamed protein product [Plutella xylostella]
MVRRLSALACCFCMFAISLCGSAIPSESDTRCKNPPTAPQKIERVITLCQDEIKLSILRACRSFNKRFTGSEVDVFCSSLPILRQQLIDVCSGAQGGT